MTMESNNLDYKSIMPLSKNFMRSKRLPVVIDETYLFILIERFYTLRSFSPPFSTIQGVFEIREVVYDHLMPKLKVTWRVRNQTFLPITVSHKNLKVIIAVVICKIVTSLLNSTSGSVSSK